MSVRKIIFIVKEEYGINNIKYECRARKYSEARMAASFFMFEKMNMGISEIGRVLERDHTTILYYLERFRDLYRYDEEFRHRMEYIENEIETALQPSI